MNAQQNSADTHIGQQPSTQLKAYKRPQLIGYGPVAQLTGGMSDLAFADNSGMTMMMAAP